MTNIWQTVKNSSRQLRNQKAKEEQSIARVSERLDTPTLIFFIVIVFILSFLGWLGAVAVDSSGIFDPPVIRPIPDARILNNIRPNSTSYVDATSLDHGDGKVVIGKKDGNVIIFDRETGLLSQEKIDNSQTIYSDVSILSAGCDWTDIQDLELKCPNKDIVFATTEEGGIAIRNSSGNWTTLISDMPWTGNEWSLRFKTKTYHTWLLVKMVIWYLHMELM